MNSKNIKVVDEHNIDREAMVIFAFDLEGSEYVSYSIERDEENSNIFVSKIIRNLDNTFNMLDIDDSGEKTRLSEIIKTFISSAVSNENDKLVGDSVTLSDGRVAKFIAVKFNKEQRINVPKTYVTTVKKEVVKVAEKYYGIELFVEQPKVVEIFPTVAPVAEPVREVSVEPVLPEVPVAPAVEPVVVATPTIDVPKTEPMAPVAPVVEEIKVVEPTPVAPVVAEPTPVVLEPVTVAVPSQVTTPVVEEVKVATAPVVESVENSAPSLVVPTAEVTNVVEPTPVVQTPEVAAPVVDSVPVQTANNEISQGLVFNASKESNLNAALGEAANSTTIPVENIEPVREFGVDQPVQAPVVNAQPIAPMVQSNITSEPKMLTKKAGFADSKFFMVVAVAFFLASCVFLGYEVFNYFQITK